MSGIHGVGWSRKGVTRRAAVRIAALGGVGVITTAYGCGNSNAPKAATQVPASAGAVGAGSPTQASVAAPKPVQPTAATLRSGIGSDVGSMDPQSLAGQGGGNWPNSTTHFDNLLQIDPQTSQLVPALLQSFETPDSGHTWTLKVRLGIKFHNGEALTAETVRFNFLRAMDQAPNGSFKSGVVSQYKGLIDTIEVPDSTTVVLHMGAVNAAFGFNITQMGGVVPMDYVKQIGDDAFAAKPVGTGPFQFVSRVADSELRSTRNDGYYRPIDSKLGPRLPAIKDLIQKVIPEDQARIAALQNSEIDIAATVATDLARQLDGQRGFKVFYLPDDQPIHIHINSALATDPQTGQPNPWRDVRVRQAANYAIDLDTIIKTLLTGKEHRTFGSSSQSFGFPQELPQKAYTYDPQKAKSLLSAAGYPNGFDATIFDPTGRWPNSSSVCQAVANYLTKAGIKTSVQQQQYAVVNTGLKEGKLYPLAFFGQKGGPDPGPEFRSVYHTGGSFFTTVPDPDMDHLVEASEQELEPQKRAQLIGQIITKFYNAAEWIFLYEPVSMAVTTDKWTWQPYAKVLSTPEYWNLRPV